MLKPCIVVIVHIAQGGYETVQAFSDVSSTLQSRWTMLAIPETSWTKEDLVATISSVVL
jgi:hypothetical protein